MLAQGAPKMNQLSFFWKAAMKKHWCRVKRYYVYRKRDLLHNKRDLLLLEGCDEKAIGVEITGAGLESLHHFPLFFRQPAPCPPCRSDSAVSTMDGTYHMSCCSHHALRARKCVYRGGIAHYGRQVHTHNCTHTTTHLGSAGMRSRGNVRRA